jgi:hypothetical protein
VLYCYTWNITTCFGLYGPSSGNILQYWYYCSNKAHTHTAAIDGFTSLPIIITQQDASHPLKNVREGKANLNGNGYGCKQYNSNVNKPQYATMFGASFYCALTLHV